MTDRPDRAAEAQRARELAAQLRSGHTPDPRATMLRAAHLLERMADPAELPNTPESSAN